MKSRIGIGLAVAIAVIGANVAQATLVSGSYTAKPYTEVPNNLISGMNPSASFINPYTAPSGQGGSDGHGYAQGMWQISGDIPWAVTMSVLTDGKAGQMDYAASGNHTALAWTVDDTAVGQYMTYAAVGGTWSISSVDIYTGSNDARNDQRLEILYSSVANLSSWSSLQVINQNGVGGAIKTTTTPDTALTGVYGVKFAFSSSQENGYVFYQELAINGSLQASGGGNVPEPGTWLLLGGSLLGLCVGGFKRMRSKLSA